MKKVLIIGAGISGATTGRVLAEAGFDVTILEKRDHIAGNIYDYYEDGVLIHKYGPHLFHTTFLDVADFVKRFSEFFPYEHRVLGEIDGELVPIPFNFKSIDMIYQSETAQHLKKILKEKYPDERDVPIMELRQHEDADVRNLAEFVYQKVFYGYTIKQWGISPENMDSTVMGRVPVRMSYDDRYFKDSFQQMPVAGYTNMVKNMLNHSQISLRLNCNAFEHVQFKSGKVLMDGEEWSGPVIYTGCIEDLFNSELGKLPYRSLNFSHEKHNVEMFQPTVQVNYPNHFTYTRISEYKLIQKNAPKTHTIITYEYPIACGDDDIPYYPIADKQNDMLYEKYQSKTAEFANLFLLGRLAEYKYYNMDQTIKQAMNLSEQIIRKFN